MSSSPAKYPTKHVDPNRALRLARNIEYPKELWYLVAGVIFLLCLWNIVSILGSIRWKSACPTSDGPGQASDDSGRKNRTLQVSNAVSIRRIPLAIASAFKIIVFRSTISLGGDLTVTLAETMIITGYCAALLTWEFINTRNITTHKNLDLTYWANRAGTIAASQTALIVALAGRNNIVSLLTGISYERLNIIHRGVARAVLLMTWIHVGGKLKAGITDWDQTWLRSGFVSLIAYTLLIFISIRPIRKAAYELFCYFHLVLVTLMLFGAYFHMQQSVGLGHYVWPALLIWAIDRMLRLARLLVYNFPHYPPVSPSTVELLSADTVRLTVRRRHVTWKPGQSMFITLPEISRLPFESHPFTISSLSSASTKGIQGEKELVFIIRARGGVTKRLRDMARDVPHKSLNVIIDGPYGSPPDLTSFSTVILFAGGSGVSYCIPLFVDLVKRAREGKALCRRVVFVWSVRELKHMQWISTSLSQALSEVPSHLEIVVRIQVTGPSTADMFTSETTSETAASSSNEKISSARDSTMDGCSPTTSNSFVLKKAAVSGSNEEESCRGSSILESHSEATSDTSSELYKLSAVTIGKGRADVRHILDEEISCAYGAVSVDVCGPHKLVETVRSALRSDIAEPIGVLKGRASVTLHVQKFGFA